MAKLKVLELNSKLMAWIGIHFDRDDFFKSFATYYHLITVVTLTITSNVVFAFLNWPKFDIIFVSCLASTAGVQCMGMLLNLGRKIKKVMTLHLKMQEMVDSVSPDSDISKSYLNAEQLSRKYTCRITFYNVANLPLIVAPVLYSIYCIFCGNLNTSTWLLPLQVWVPFDSRSIWGWYFLWFIQSNILGSYPLCLTSITSYFVSCCTYVTAFCDHFDALMKSINKKVEEIQKGKMHANHQQIREGFSKAIECHTKTLE